LRLVEDYDVVKRWLRSTHTFIPEVVHILDKSLNRLSNDPLAHAVGKPSGLVAYECFLEHGDKWTVSREKDSARLAEVAAASCDIEPDQRLSRARHTSDKND
jgi:hypothetical protein